MPYKITEERIEEILDKSNIIVETVFEKVTQVTVQLENGFVLSHSSGCVDPKDYNKELGAKICLEKIKDKLWELEGYMLQELTHNSKKFGGIN